MRIPLHHQERFARLIWRITTSETVGNWAIMLIGIAVLFLMVLAASEPTYISQ